MASRLTVVKIGGSVLTGRAAYRRAADFIASRISAAPADKLIAVVSAETGVTDSLLATARELVEDPDPRTVDLLWSTGETRSAALLTLALQARGVRARAINVHETGLRQPLERCAPGESRVSPLRIRSLLDEHDVIVAPGFLARAAGDAIVSLGRGGSDLTAVVLAAGLEADGCELLKDVPGYFSADPKRDPEARPLESLSYDRAIEMADTGCQLVQRHALVAARDNRLPLVITAIGHDRHTRIH